MFSIEALILSLLNKLLVHSHTLPSPFIIVITGIKAPTIILAHPGILSAKDFKESHRLPTKDLTLSNSNINIYRAKAIAPMAAVTHPTGVDANIKLKDAIANLSFVKIVTKNPIFDKAVTAIW